MAAACAPRPDVVAEPREGGDGKLYVVNEANGTRTLRFEPNGARQTSIIPGRPDVLVLEYSRVAMLGLALATRPKRVLIIGLGGGAIPMYLRHHLPDLVIDVVDIDADVVRVARTHFAFREDDRLTAHVADGRRFIEGSTDSYDIVWLDAYSNDGVPYALTTREFLEAVHARVAPDGLVVANLWPRSRYYPHMVQTYRAVFQELQLVRVPHRGNTILVALPRRRGLDRAAVIAASRALGARLELGFDLPALVSQGFSLVPSSSTARVLTDSGPPTSLQSLQRRGQ